MLGAVGGWLLIQDLFVVRSCAEVGGAWRYMLRWWFGGCGCLGCVGFRRLLFGFFMLGPAWCQRPVAGD
jgi:hypothetical protein